ncbi:hypothetical protein M3204_16835 [Mesobacillus subterraneus]|uniref:hypothetical protein n=1 Tax=Mesobacillus subterraneus TaxID=285983 RepID=UPI0020417BA1|nr:hypothetical protein [Mesobacillus subterraneus]MCM3666086.1 hypothetical protein [Mesobacillus subterraneus]MCM3685084.1 hypothetical protein [Mesobacillus subterraneus]
MNKISLSIEELIYCFYNEGFFEHGNALKQVYFGDLDDEKMDLLLQVTTRSLLSKSLMVYENHKFTLVEELAEIISMLNYSEQSIKASRHAANGGEQSVSFHFNGKTVLQHSMLYDDQVHVFEKVSVDAAAEFISGFYRVSNRGNGNGFELSNAEFEQLLDSLEDNQKLFDLPVLHGEKQQFYETLKATNGLLNTLLFLEFTEQKEPVAKNVVLFTNDLKNNWIIEKNEDFFYLNQCDRREIYQLIKNNVIDSLEKVQYGK